MTDEKRTTYAQHGEKETSMKTELIILATTVALLAGCRREDWRETVIEAPGLTQSNSAAVDAALSRYEGVDVKSVKKDFDKKTITVRYDSMKVAQTNLRMALTDKGIEVVFPENKTGVAGYINTRK